MLVDAQYSKRDIRSSKDGKEPMEENYSDEIETVFVGQPGINDKLVAETENGQSQLEVGRFKPGDLDKSGDFLGNDKRKDAISRQEEIDALRAIVNRISARGGLDQIMAVSEVSGSEIEGEKFTITESNQDEVRKILADRGYQIIDLVSNVPNLGFRARKFLTESGNSDLDLVFLISKEK